MPELWAFDQFATDITIGEGNGRISIDKVAISRLDKGFNLLSKPTQIGQVYNSLIKIERVARTYLENKPSYHKCISKHKQKKKNMNF